MTAKRGRNTQVTVELPALPPAGQAALPAVCYVPSMQPDDTDANTQANGASRGARTPPVKRLRYEVYAKPRGTQLVTASLGNIDYVGRTDGDENAGVQPCAYALAVYRPGEQKVQLFPVAGERVFRLDSRLPGLIYAPTDAGAEENADEREKRKLAAKRLVDEFGSTRRRRQLTAREAGVVVADKISGSGAVQEMLGSVAAAGEGEGLTKEEMARRAFAQRTVPPHDPDATTPHGAYHLELLLGDGQGGTRVGALKKRIVALEAVVKDPEEEAKAREKQRVHEYVLSRLPSLRAQRLRGETDAEERQRAARRTSYLALLNLLLRLKSRRTVGMRGDDDSLAKAWGVPDDLAELLANKFYVRNDDPVRGVRYERSDAQEQLLLSYVLATAVVAEEGILDRDAFEGLRAALQMDANKMAMALQQLGASTKPAKLKVERDGREVELACYTVNLLRDVKAPGKRLAECFPAIKVSKGPKGR